MRTYPRAFKRISSGDQSLLAATDIRGMFGYARTRPKRAARSCTPSYWQSARTRTASGDPLRVDPVLDSHSDAFRPDPLPGYVWLQLPDRIREVHRQCLEFLYDPPGCALTDEELELLRRIAAAAAPVMFQAEGRTVPAHLAFDHRVDVLRDLRKAGRIVLEVWVAEPGNRGHARRRYSAAQARCTEAGRETIELIGG
jgi:hypothetical protein